LQVKFAATSVGEYNGPNLLDDDMLQGVRNYHARLVRLLLCFLERRDNGFNRPIFHTNSHMLVKEILYPYSCGSGGLAAWQTHDLLTQHLEYCLCNALCGTMIARHFVEVLSHSQPITLILVVVAFRTYDD
jgi:hypothetical protein